MPPKNGMREILREELDTLALSANALSKALDVPVNRITAILHGQRAVTADTALRLARYFGTTIALARSTPGVSWTRNASTISRVTV